MVDFLFFSTIRGIISGNILSLLEHFYKRYSSVNYYLNDN